MALIATAGGAGDQRVRHPGKIGDHRRTADVLAQHQGQRRARLLVDLGAQHLAKEHRLALLVRDLDADRRLARYHLDDADTDLGQRAREVLGERRDLVHLHARRKLHLEQRDDRSRVHGADLRLHPEVH